MLKSKKKQVSAQKEYRSPRLSVLGTVRDVTLGGSLGSGDSGATSIETV